MVQVVRVCATRSGGGGGAVGEGGGEGGVIIDHIQSATRCSTGVHFTIFR